MGNKPLNRSLHAAKATKQDEFYTQLSDIEKELRHYTKHFRNKTVLCNCDDPKASNFFHYFSHNFEKLKLKKLVTTCYKNCNADLFSQHTDERGIYLEYDGDKSGNRVPDPDEIGIHKLRADGDFRSEECIKLLQQADIVVTNPPFSLFREYIAQLMQLNKKFLVIANHNAITYNEIFQLINCTVSLISRSPLVGFTAARTLRKTSSNGATQTKAHRRDRPRDVPLHRSEPHAGGSLWVRQAL